MLILREFISLPSDMPMGKFRIKDLFVYTDQKVGQGEAGLES
jgi:hypothetical protein